jgi:thioredoxin-like negative regulator of GroEL
MSHSQPSSTKFWIYAAVILLAGGGGLAALWPSIVRASHAESAQLVREAQQASGGEAETDYQLATWLDHGNTEAYAGLARAQVASGHAEAALDSLARAGEGSDVEQLKVRILLELGRTNEAANEATQLVAPGRSDADLLLAAMAYASAGRAVDESITSRLSSPEALQHARRADASAITLAAELYASGLLRSSSAILTKLPASYERNVLLARIGYDRHTPADLAKAVDLLTAAVTYNPVSLEARQLLANIYHDQNNPEAATRQEALIAKLRSAQP